MTLNLYSQLYPITVMSQRIQQERISCLCGNAAQELDLDLPSFLILPLCHCQTCRLTSGLLCTSYLDLASRQSPDVSGLSKYAEAENVNRWFCRTCGAHVFLQIRTHDAERFLVAAGLVQSGDVQTAGIRHRCVMSTSDGGIASFLQESEREPSLLTCHTGIENSGSQTAQLNQGSTPNRNRSTLSPSAPHISTEEKAKTKSDMESSLPGQCHCGGVKYYITPPNENSRSPSSPWPDVLVPFHSASSKNPDDIKWWLVKGKDNSRRDDTAKKTYYLPGLCACQSCRLASGFPIQSWAFVPRCNIFKEDGSPLLDYDITTLQTYASSPGVYREFCRRCGATVFWHCDWRPGVVDVSVGLLQSTTGVRAENWLQWASERVSFSEEGPDQGLILCLQNGLKATGQRNADETT